MLILTGTYCQISKHRRIFYFIFVSHNNYQTQTTFPTMIFHGCLFQFPSRRFKFVILPENWIDYHFALLSPYTKHIVVFRKIVAFVQMRTPLKLNKTARLSRTTSAKYNVTNVKDYTRIKFEKNDKRKNAGILLILIVCLWK